MKFSSWYDKNYKKLLVIPAIVLTLCLIYLGAFYVQNGDIIRKDVTLSGGTTITIFSEVSLNEFQGVISEEFSDFDIRSVSDNSGTQIEIIVTVKEERGDDLIRVLEDFLGYELNQENSSIETTTASLSQDFYKQLVTAVILAFFWMSAVVFLIFGKGIKIKTWVVLLNVLFGFFLGNYLLKINPVFSIALLFGFIGLLVYIYIKNSVPSFAVMLSAFADIVITLSIVNLFGMNLSMAGIVAFLMIIGYSVDTDILLTTRLLKKKESVNWTLFEAFKTGTTMTMTSIIAVGAALIAVYSFGTALNQIFIILLIGLFVDIFITWVANASIIKWYVETK